MQGSSSINAVFQRYRHCRVDLSDETLQHTYWALKLLAGFVVLKDKMASLEDEGIANATELVDVHQVSRDTVEDWRAWLVRTKGLKKSGANSAVAGAAPVFRWAATRKERLIRRNPFRRVRRFRVQPVPLEFTAEEVERMVKVADLRWQGMIRVGCTAGAERGFVQNLTWDDFDFRDPNKCKVLKRPKYDDPAKGTWAWTPKRRGCAGDYQARWKPVSVHVPDILVQLRTMLHPEQPYPFVAGCRYWDLRADIGHLSKRLRDCPDANFNRMFNLILERANVPKMMNGRPRKFHTLRGTAITSWARDMNLSPADVQHLADHADGRTTQLYYEAVRPAAVEIACGSNIA